MSLVSTHEVSLWQPHISNCPLGDMAPVETGVLYFLPCTDCILLAYPAIHGHWRGCWCECVQTPTADRPRGLRLQDGQWAGQRMSHAA